MAEGGITPAQCRAARAVVGWNQDILAEKASLSRATLVEFEKGTRLPHANNLGAIRRAFEELGVLFETGEERYGLSFMEPDLEREPE